MPGNTEGAVLPRFAVPRGSQKGMDAISEQSEIRNMDPFSNPGPLTGHSKALCEVIVDTLREIRLTTTRPLTPELLGKFLAKSGAYMEKLHAMAELFVPEDKLELKRHVERLHKFQVDLLESFYDNYDHNYGVHARELLESVRMKIGGEEIAGANEEIIRFVDETNLEVSGQIDTYLQLIADITTELIEVEQFLYSSSSSLNEAYKGNKSFHMTIEYEVKDIGEFLESHQDVDELRQFIEVKLDNIRQSLLEKQAAEESQINKLTGEIESFKTRLHRMKKEVVRVQKKAEQLEKASLMDHLTGIPNRRAYEKYIREEWQRYRKTQDVFSLLMVDIDNFKSINDKYGHWAGDKCLEELVKRVRSKLRDSDFLARYGGDEFLIVLPNTDKDGAVHVSEKLRAHIEQTRFLYRGQRIPFGISIGVCAIDPADQNLRSVLNRVDKALYNAKACGRNCIYIV